MKTKYKTDKTDLEKKILHMTNVKRSKLTELESKIQDVIGLATKLALTAVENKIPNFSSLVKKTDYDTKISEFEKTLLIIITPKFNTLAARFFNARLVQANLITKKDFDSKLSSLIRKLLQIKQNICLF